jgi:omega-hydroxy-beta-dihydromenaquinone-9 sulfotransferase
MDWRETMLAFCGPGVLSGLKVSDWVRLLAERRGDISLSRLPRVASITLQSVKNSAVGVVERGRYYARIRKVEIQPPIFVLGHWRSGTTHLHQLLTQDNRFAFPNSYQTAFPHIFLSSEKVDARLLSFFMPKRRPMDNVGLTFSSPQEDEFALCGSCLRSPCMGWVFPKQREHFNRYLTFKGVEGTEVERWKTALEHFIRKVQWRTGRPLILKSPPHTARIQLLLEIFPGAKFVHIHRNPFHVFQSARRLLITMFRWHSLQEPDLASLDDWVISQYQEMYEAFFAQKKQIPKGRFHEVGFEQLERDAVGEVRQLYQALELPEFSFMEPQLKHYVASVAGYRKNSFPEIATELKSKLAKHWARCFQEWGYSTE